MHCIVCCIRKSFNSHSSIAVAGVFRLRAISFQAFCYRLLDVLAVGQIYYLVQSALEYLYQQKALKPRNENFINTNLLKKTLQQYRERSVNENGKPQFCLVHHNYL